MARLGLARRGTAGRGEARQGIAKQGHGGERGWVAGKGIILYMMCAAGRGTAGRGMARLGRARPGEARRGKDSGWRMGVAGGVIPTSWLKKWAEIEKEWGKHPRLLVQDWRADSTYRTICAALGVCDKTLLVWREFWGLPIDVNDNGQDEFTIEGYKNGRKTERAARHLGFDDFEDAYRYFKLRELLSDPEIARKLEIGVRSVVRRKPAELQGLAVQHTRRGRELR